PVDLPDRDRREIDVVQTSHVDRPEVWRRPRPTEGKDPARGAEIVLGGSRMPLVEGKLVERRQETEAGFLDPMGQRASLPTDAAVAQPNMVDVRIDLEANLPAVTGPLVGLHPLLRGSIPRTLLT